MSAILVACNGIHHHHPMNCYLKSKQLMCTCTYIICTASANNYIPNNSNLAIAGSTSTCVSCTDRPAFTRSLQFTTESTSQSNLGKCNKFTHSKPSLISLLQHSYSTKQNGLHLYLQTFKRLMCNQLPHPLALHQFT